MSNKLLSDDINDYLHQSPFVSYADIKRWKYKAKVLQERVKKCQDHCGGAIKGMLDANKALEEQVKELQITDCNCSSEETTGWTTFRLCNICGKIQEKK